MTYLKLFFVFFKVGLFSFGGGYAILPLMRHEVVDINKWISFHEFMEIVAISQITPGPISINLATHAGYRIAKSANINRYTFIFPIIIALLIKYLGVSPVIIIIATMILGNIYFLFKEKSKKEKEDDVQ